jgi:hypothetical protein
MNARVVVRELFLATWPYSVKKDDKVMCNKHCRWNSCTHRLCIVCLSLTINI